MLAARLVALYKEDNPDMVTVVLEADGFADLLDRADFIERISDQDNRIVTKVRDLTAQVNKQAKDLGALEAEATIATNRILSQRNEIASAKGAIVARQSDLVAARNKRDSALSSIKASRTDLEGHLHQLEGKQAQIEARLRAAQTGVSAPGPAGPIRRGSGNFIWPVNGPIVSPFGMRWGRLHAGHRHRGAERHADPRGRGGDGRVHAAGGLVGRLRQLHLHRPRRRHLHLLRPPVELRRLERPAREPGPGDRRIGLHRALLRAAPALRGARERRARGSAR